MFNGYKVSVWDNEKVQEMDGGNDCTTMWMYYHKTIHLKMVEIVSFKLYIVYHN